MYIVIIMSLTPSCRLSQYRSYEPCMKSLSHGAMQEAVCFRPRISRSKPISLPCIRMSHAPSLRVMTITPCSSNKSPGSESSQLQDLQDVISIVAALVTSLFPLWVCTAGAVAILRPSLFDFFQLSYVTPALGLTMLGMGLTLRVEDFVDVSNKLKV